MVAYLLRSQELVCVGRKICLLAEIRCLPNIWASTFVQPSPTRHIICGQFNAVAYYFRADELSFCGQLSYWLIWEWQNISQYIANVGHIQLKQANNALTEVILYINTLVFRHGDVSLFNQYLIFVAIWFILSRVDLRPNQKTSELLTLLSHFLSTVINTPKMGNGRGLTVVNGTPHQWVRKAQWTYQMGSQSWPEKVEACRCKCSFCTTLS